MMNLTYRIIFAGLLAALELFLAVVTQFFYPAAYFVDLFIS
jgi:hypothetical protein